MLLQRAQCGASQPRRYQHQHTGAPTSTAANSIHVSSTVSMRMMLRKLASHIWPKDQPRLRLRVAGAMMLLIGAKVLFVLLWFFCFLWYQ